jgi:hypothetical protein
VISINLVALELRNPVGRDFLLVLDDELAVVADGIVKVDEFVDELHLLSKKEEGQRERQPS